MIKNVSNLITNSFVLASFADPARVSGALKRFVEVQADDKTLLELLVTVTDTNSEYKQIIEAKVITYILINSPENKICFFFSFAK